MLSGETSVGKFPVEVIESMHKIIQYTEKSAYRYYREHPPKDFNRTFLSDSVCYTACKMAQQSKAKAIVVFTHSGSTAFKIAGYRPNADIYVFTSNKDILARMSLLWGVKAYYFDKFADIEKAIEQTIGILLHEEHIKHDDLVIHVGSTPLHQKGRANMLKLSYV
jgi:pyruvate kinase